MNDFSQKMAQVKERFRQLESEMSNPAVFDDRKRYSEISKEHQRLSSLIECYDRLQKSIKELEENDAELLEVINSDIKSLKVTIPQIEKELKLLIVPPNPNDSRNSIIEIRPAAGGDEAALFAEELMRMYQIYSAQKGWKVDILDYTPSDLGGLKSASFMISGEDVYRELMFESGVHRVQRVPATETQGRIHTSTVTVAVLPEAEEVDIQINPADLRFDVYRSSGAGGQCVNTTDSAVRVTHIPTGISFASQQERSQHKNRDIAIKMLRSKMLEIKIQEEQKKMADERKGQVGTGDRSERIRTYNFPQNRLTDHRYGITRYDLPEIMRGNVGPLFNEILTIEAENKLENELKK